jgi:hypothetical protein
MQHVSGKKFGKHVPVATNMHATTEERCFLCGPCREVITRRAGAMDPCGGEVEYLHRDPESRRRRRKGKSQN